MNRIKSVTREKLQLAKLNRPLLSRLYSLTIAIGQKASIQGDRTCH